MSHRVLEEDQLKVETSFRYVELFLKTKKKPINQNYPKHKNVDSVDIFLSLSRVGILGEKKTM